MLKNLLLYRFILFNAGCASLMAWFASKGWLTMVAAADPTGISWGIVALFLLSGAGTAVQAWKLNRERNGTGKPTNPTVRGGKLKRIERAGESMALLGLIGTIVGFIIAFATSDPAALLNATEVGSGVATMMKGMGVALYTTLTGAVLGGWTGENYHMLKEQADLLDQE